MARLLSPLHGLWRRLPKQSRRRLFFAVSKLRAPRLPDPGPGQAPWAVGGLLRTANGLGESARLCLAALEHMALEHSVGAVGQADLSGSLLGAVDLPAPAGHAMDAGPGTLVLHVNSPFVPHALAYLGRRRLAGKRIIGYWAWELPDVPADWRHGAGHVHEVWVPSRFCADAIRPIFRGTIRVVAHPVALSADLPEPSAQAGDGVFRVVTVFNMGSGFERKNPLGTVRAFRQAFGARSDVRLTLKMMNGAHYPEGEARLRAEIGDAANIELVTRIMPRPELMGLLAASDVVMSLHRSEGFGLLVAEGMLLGKPVVATDWSGSTDFLKAGNGCPVGYRLQPAVDPQGNYHYPGSCWADPDISEAAAWLCRLKDDPALRTAIGAQARSDALVLFSADAFARACGVLEQPARPLSPAC